jgi:hypothetical protein
MSIKTSNILKTCRACQRARFDVPDNTSIARVGKRPRPATRKEHERISVANDDESERLAKKRKTEVKAAERQDVEEARRSLRAKDSE